MSSDLRKGWAGSLAAHAVVLLLFFLLRVPEIHPKAEFVELSWGGEIAPVPETPLAIQPAPEPSAPADTREVTPRVQKNPSLPVVLPERRLPDLSDGVISVPKSTKLEAAAPSADAPPTTKPVARSEQSGVSVENPGRTEKGSLRGSRGLQSDRMVPGGGSVPGSEIGAGVGYSIQWSQGGIRRKISGELPKYPPGVNVEAEIKLMAVVVPDGGLRAVQPIQKANTALEDAAVEKVRLWKFEPLKSSSPQIEQSCMITFLFKLK
ncbi:MAG: hypothetical protein WBD36_14415 [Bacteroidota bacterium]